MSIVTREDYIEYINKIMGGSLVNIEISEDIPYFVDSAFKEIKNHITDVQTMTLPYAPVIDLAGKKIANILYLMRGHNTSGPGGFQDIMYIYSRQSALNTYTLTDYARYLLVQQNKSMLGTDMDFHFDKRNEKLYIYAQQALPTTVTLVYTPDYDSVDEITEPFWQDLIRRLSLALVKEAVGRVRSKYDLGSSTYKLDGDKLLAEAQQEEAEIREYLRTNTDMLFPLD